MGYEPHRSQHSLLNKNFPSAGFSTLTSRSDIDHRSSLKSKPQYGPQNSNADPVAVMQKDIAAATTASGKKDAAMKAINGAKNDPALTRELLPIALKLMPDNQSKGELMVDMAKFNPAIVAELAQMSSKLTSLEGDTRLSKGIALLDLSKTNIRGATLAENTDLSRNNLQGANLAVTAPGLITAGAYGEFSAQGAHVNQKGAVDRNAAQLSLAGGETGSFSWDPAAKKSGGAAPVAKKDVEFPTPFSMDLKAFG